VLGDRAAVLAAVNDPPMTVSPLPEGDDPDCDVLTCFRSLIVRPLAPCDLATLRGLRARRVQVPADLLRRRGRLALR